MKTKILENIPVSGDRTNLVGGFEGLHTILEEFYTRIYADMMIGYFFHPFPKDKLVLSQAEFVYKLFGGRDRESKLRGLREIHSEFRITPGHFMRRHQILKEVLLEQNLENDVVKFWLEADLKLMPLIIQE